MYGGGAAEISSSIAVSKAADEVRLPQRALTRNARPTRLPTHIPDAIPVLQIPSIEQYAMRAFASALDQIPLALAENSGLSPIDALADVKSRQVTEKNYRLGIDCVGAGENDMKKQHVFDPLLSKRQQYLLATQLVRAVLKVSQAFTCWLLRP